MQDTGTLVLLHIWYAGRMSAGLGHKQHNETPGLHGILAIVQEMSVAEKRVNQRWNQSTRV